MIKQQLKTAIRKSFNAVGLDIHRVNKVDGLASFPPHVEEFSKGFDAQLWSTPPAKEFGRNFRRNLESCTWKPHPLFSVFTQYDQEFYLREMEAFLYKYRCFYAVSKTISPKKIIELGTHAGSSADAYLSAAPDAEYVGLDQFEDGVLQGLTHHVYNTPWLPQEVAMQLFEARGFKNYKLIKIDLRSLDKLPVSSDFVVVDAAHDFENEYRDLKLALTADPLFIFVDDAYSEAKSAIERFMNEDLMNRVEYLFLIDYIGGGLVIKLKD